MTPARPGRRADQQAIPRAVKAIGSMSQLIKAAAATHGDAASIIASQGRPDWRTHQGPERDQKQGTEQHRIDVDEDQCRVHPLLVRQVGPLQSAERAGDQTLQLQEPAGEHRILQNRVATVVEVGSVALQQAATGVQEADIGVAQVFEMVGWRCAGDGDPAGQAEDNDRSGRPECRPAG